MRAFEDLLSYKANGVIVRCWPSGGFSVSQNGERYWFYYSGEVEHVSCSGDAFETRLDGKVSWKLATPGVSTAMPPNV